VHGLSKLNRRVFPLNTLPTNSDSHKLRPLMKIDDVAYVTQLSHSTINRKAYDQRDSFPAPFKISGNSVRWVVQDVIAWIDLMKQGGAA